MHSCIDDLIWDLKKDEYWHFMVGLDDLWGQEKFNSMDIF